MADKYLDINGLEYYHDIIQGRIDAVEGEIPTDYVKDDDTRLTNKRTPTSHASTGTTYGVGTTSSYGHCKTINNLTTSSHTNGYALSAYQGYLLATTRLADSLVSTETTPTTNNTINWLYQ